MPFDGLARWQIDIMAADKTAAAFASLDRRVTGAEKSISGLGATVARQGMMSQAGSAAMSAGFALATRALGPLAAGFTAAAVAEQVFATGLKVGALADQATQLGISTDLLQAWRLAAATAGVEARTLDQAILTLNGQMHAAKGGNDEAIARFKKLEVNLLDAKGELRGVADVLPEVSRGLIKIGTDSERNGLAQDMLSTKGARTVSMLETFAQGNERAIRTAKDLNAVSSGESIAAWNKLDAQMKITQQRWETLIAALGTKVVLPGLEHVLAVFESTRKEVEGIQRAWDWLTKSAPLDKQLAGVQNDINAFLDRGYSLDDPAVQDLVARRDALQAKLNSQPIVLPEVTVTAPGVSNPTGKIAGKAAEKLDERLKELQTERAALEKALAAFNMGGLQTVDEIDRRLDSQVKLDKKIFDVLKDVPPNSPLAVQLTQEATAISQISGRLDERKRLLTEGQQVIQQYGDGTWAAARAAEQLNNLLAAGVINQGTYNAALKVSIQQTDDMARAYRGAGGGIDGFQAGMEQALAEMGRANSAFEMGKQLVDQVSDAITDMATGAELDFGRIALSFMGMLLQMELRAAASNVFNMLRGSGPTDQGIGGMIAGLIGSVAGGAGGYFDAGPIAVGGIPTIGLAGGGDNPVGVPYLVGENGPEVRVDGPGHIFNREQWNGGGGGVSVTIPMTNNIGNVVSRAELEMQLAAVEERARKGAIAGVIEAKGRGGDYRNAFRR